jgi:hypothetical protein
MSIPIVSWPVINYQLLWQAGPEQEQEVLKHLFEKISDL